ncbi:MAG TPA: topoisomerase II [Planctomycetaceae bacterium]|nr:topoisomerase II [Planctomycetaceae bacterium]
MAKSTSHGLISTNEAYSKRELIARLGVSQKFWDQMLDNGLHFTQIGHQRWVWGHKVIEYIEKHSKQKS